MFHINNRPIGDGHPCFITFEIGPTHNGVESAKRLIRHAAEAGADAVKFQIFDPDRLVADKAQLFSYGILKNRISNEVIEVTEPLYDILKRRCLTEGEWREVKSYSDKLGMAFFATVGFDEDIDLLEDLQCHSIKVGSADVNHFPLLRKAARTGMCIQLDTGMASLEEISTAVKVVRSEGNNNIIVHQCPSGYPAHLSSINLNIITSLKKMFSFPIAYSDHTPGVNMDLAAVALGANLVEKTITEDRTTPSVEHSMSIEPNEMKSFIRDIRNLEIALGSNKRLLSSKELQARLSVRRSLFLKSSVKKGDQMVDSDIEFRRPGYGIPPDKLDSLKNVKFIKNMVAGTMLELTDLRWDE
jgi:N,N'-diacetyllegionaminate synthase